MTIHLLRHTTPNIAKGICYGQSDIDLADTFDKELKFVKEQLKSINYDAVFTSPLLRCQQLAQALCQPNMSLEIDERLMEMDFGLWEGQSWEIIAKDEYSKLWFDDFVHTPTPNGESFIDLSRRTQDFIKDLKRNNTANTPLVVTHAGNIRAINAMVNNVDLSKAFDLPLSYGALLTVII